MNSLILEKIKREDSLDKIQQYVEKNTQNQNISKEMFKLFTSVIELGKAVRISIKENNNLNSESKIIDIFLALLSICNHLNINLFEALLDKNNSLKETQAKWI